MADDLLEKDVPKYSTVMRLINAATVEAAEQAVAAGYDPNANAGYLEENEFLRHLRGACEPILDAFRSFMVRPDEQERLLSHRHNLLAEVKQKSYPEISRPEVEQIVGSYIRGAVKTATVDRLLVDLLVALEFSQYANLVLHAPHIPFLAPRLLNRRPILDWLSGNILNVIMAFFVFALFWGASVLGIFPLRWLWIIAYGLVVLLVLNAGWGLIWLPRVWWIVRKARGEVLQHLGCMNSTYAALSSEGPISAQHVTALATKAADAGVVWPAPLYVLLEDIQRRGGTF
ncbi:hypothetical protein [uncultured Brevundimonas sp.]|uniref:hypothetical protein n=1 Tax=uncultured Brevundimonas sp. TaxID=213418 RepID=UPI00261E4BC0|nr:hypothetical protein [uncultured Brevundimonas sp.]